MNKEPRLKQNQIQNQNLQRFGKSVAHSDLQFWFAPNDYVGIVNASVVKRSDIFVKIEDKRERKKSTTYPTQIIPVSSLNFVHLCGYSQTYKHDKFTKYKPVSVDLSNPEHQNSYKIYELYPFIFRLNENPKDVQDCEASGCYTMHLEIFAEGNFNLRHNQQYKGIRAVNQSEEALQIADFNFDGHLDFSMYDNAFRQYFLYNSSEMRFCRDSLLSSFEKVDLDVDVNDSSEQPEQHKHIYQIMNLNAMNTN